MTGIKCTPWYYPTADKPLQICNPWESQDFQFFKDTIPDETCAHCLPDCSGAQYTTTVYSSPFRRCDSKNLGVSFLCDITDPTLPEPRIWGKQVLLEYLDEDENATDVTDLPEYVQNQVRIKSIIGDCHCLIDIDVAGQD